MIAHGLSAVVLAGSHQWSGSAFEKLGPRPLVPVALAPVISYPLRWLHAAGVLGATICVNGTGHVMETAIGDGADLDMRLAYYHDRTPRGAAGCVRDAALLAGSETLVVADGTAIPTVDLSALLVSHFDSRAAMTAVVHREARSTGASPAGLYVFDRRALDHVAEHGFQDIKENLIPALRRAGERVLAYESGGFSPHILDAPTYLAVNQWMIQRLAGEGFGSSLIDPGARVEPGALLVGPVQLGPGAVVESGATVVGPTTISDSTVRRNALVARSAVWSRCVVGEGAIVHRSVIGNDAVIPPGARLFNTVRSRETRSAVRLPRTGPAAASRRALPNWIRGSFPSSETNG
jgi:NDP-sugar pyrophosphorylase family protein